MYDLYVDIYACTSADMHVYVCRPMYACLYRGIYTVPLCKKKIFAGTKKIFVGTNTSEISEMTLFFSRLHGNFR